MPPFSPKVWLDIILQSLTLFFLIVGLAGLVIPVFPGLTVMWIATLVYAMLQQMAKAMTVWDWILFALITILMIAGNIIDKTVFIHDRIAVGIAIARFSFGDRNIYLVMGPEKFTRQSINPK